MTNQLHQSLIKQEFFSGSRFISLSRVSVTRPISCSYFPSVFVLYRELHKFDSTKERLTIDTNNPSTFSCPG